MESSNDQIIRKWRVPAEPQNTSFVGRFEGSTIVLHADIIA